MGPEIPRPRRDAKPVLEVGQLMATPGAFAALSGEDFREALGRHMRGDWGNVCAADAAENDLSVREGFRVLSAYTTKQAGITFWVITEADRSSTTFLLPEEY